MEMDNIVIKMRLINAGFSKKEITFISFCAEKEKKLWIDIVIDLRLYFLGGMLFRFVALIFCVLSFVFNYDLGGIIFTLTASLFIAEFIAPFKLGARVFLRFNKIIA
ncbi:MAG TPA: hypothetical protein DEO73_06810 [Pantoea sp.]|nr:hypothetical protein [Pantoea sp.]